MAEVVRKVRPTPSDKYLGNPHKGCCTFQRFNGDPLFPGVGWSEAGPTEFPPTKAPVVDGYLPTTVAYCRWFWSIMEPQKGKYDFSVIDRSLATCKERGQSLAIRLMAFGSRNQPQVPAWYSSKYPMAKPTKGHGEDLAPVHDAPEYLEHWGGFIREAGRRYDGNPLMESIDITYIGPWGEGAGTCSASRCREFTQLWKEAWPKTPRIGMVSGDKMVEAVASGAGWRCDCFGDLSDTGGPNVMKHASWNHHFDCYPREVYVCGAADAWKAAPVHFETCWVPMHWYKRKWDLDFIIEQGLKFHGTYFMPKSSALPEAWMDKLAAFCRKLGYSFVLRYALFDGAPAVSGEFRFQCWIENVGVAPIYRKYDLALRLRQGASEAIIPLADVDIRKWLPGDVWLDRKIAVPEGIQKGWAELSIGLIDPQTKQPKVRFAVKEQFSDGWVPLDGMIIS